MNSQEGWVKVYRRLTSKGYYQDSEYVHLWVHILLRANHEPKEFLWNGVLKKVQAGQFIAGRQVLSRETGISESKVERILKTFESEQQIEQQKTNRFRLITILNWPKYQQSEQQIEQPVNNKRTTSEQPVDTNKNEKNDKNEKNIDRAKISHRSLKTNNPSLLAAWKQEHSQS